MGLVDRRGREPVLVDLDVQAVAGGTGVVRPDMALVESDTVERDDPAVAAPDVPVGAGSAMFLRPYLPTAPEGVQ